MRALLFFLFNPLLGFINAMKDLDRRLNGWVFVAFYALFGYAISFTLTTADSYRIAADFCVYDKEYQTVLEMYREGYLTDIYLTFVKGLLQLFTRNPKVLYGVLGAVMGAFSYLSIKQLYAIWRDNRDKYFYILVFFFFLVISFFNVNGIRFWTATSWFSYFAIRNLYFGKKRAIVGVILTPLIHFGYLIGVGGFIIFVIIRHIIKSPTLYYYLMLIAFVVSLAVPNTMAGDIMGSMGDSEELTSSRAFNRKAESYIHSEENAQKKEENRQYKERTLYREANSLFTRTFDYVNKVGMVIMLTLLYRKRRSIIQDKVQSDFFNYVLFSFALGFFACFMIGSGGRFIRIANMMYVFWLFTVFRRNVMENPKWKQYVRVLFLLNFYAIAFLLFNAPRLVTSLFWFAPPAFTIIDGIGFAPIDFI